MKSLFGIVLGAAFVFFTSWYLVNSLGINNLSLQSEDTLPALFLPYSIIETGTIYLDPYYMQLLNKYPQPDDKDFSKGNVPFYLKKVGEHYLSAFTIIVPLLAVPVYLIPVLTGVPPSWENLIILSHLTEALLIGLAGWLLFMVCKNRLGVPEKKAYLVTFIYLFATINFALISQALWQHGAVQLLLLAGLYFYLNMHAGKMSLIITGVFWGFAFLARPTALLPIALFALGILICKDAFTNNLKNTGWLAVGFIPAAVFFSWYNSTFYGSFSNQGYSSQLFTSWLGDFPFSFIGVWLSPSKGILIYSPILVFSLVGLLIALKNKMDSHRLVYLISGATVVLHTLVISFWKHWYGGWAFGYRMSSDVLPFFSLLIIPFLQSSAFVKYKRIFLFLLVFSVAVQVFGIIFYDGIWHAAYDRGFHDTSWLWSLTDSEFAFNVRRVLVKMNLLDKACPTCAAQ